MINIVMADIKTDRITAAASENKLFVLVIEDNRVINDFLRSILRRHLAPCHLSFATSYLEALEYLGKQIYHLVLIDTTLDQVSGEECCKYIREGGYEIPIILMALSEMKITQEQVVAIGADGIIYKPIERDDLLREITEVLDIDLSQRGTPSKFYRVPRFDE
jgi:two-component system OmpR family response regulator/two-component system response regulator QseB